MTPPTVNTNSKTTSAIQSASASSSVPAPVVPASAANAAADWKKKKARQELADIIDWKSIEGTPSSTSASSSSTITPYSITQQQQDRVVALLQQHSSLAAECFSDCRPLKNKYPPLTFLVENNASLAAVQLTYDKYPAAIYHKDRWGNLPLHFACMARAHVSLLQFLMHRYPQAAATPNRVGYYPLHFLMSPRSGRVLTKDMINALIVTTTTTTTMNSTSLVSLRGKTDLGFTPLQLALKSLLPEDVMVYLFQVAAAANNSHQQHPQHSKQNENNHDKTTRPNSGTTTSADSSSSSSSWSMSLRVSRTDDGCLQLSHAKAIAALLQAGALNEFIYHPSGDLAPPHVQRWTRPAFVHCLTAAARSTNLHTISLTLPRQWLLVATSVDCHAALEALLASPSLLHVTLKGDEESNTFATENENENNDNACMETIAKGMESNTNLQTLVLSGFALQSSRPLARLVSPLAQPQTMLELMDIQCAESWDTTTTATPIRMDRQTYCNGVGDNPNHNFVQEQQHPTKNVADSSCRNLHLKIDVADNDNNDNDRESRSWQFGLLKQLPHIMPHLETLSLLCQMDSIDLTDILVSLLSSSSTTSQGLTRLTVVGNVHVQHQHIAQVLASHNVTLTSFAHDSFNNSGRSWIRPEVQAQIQYYCQLNRYGKAKVQDTTHCSLKGFVQLLVKLLSASGIQKQQKQQHPPEEEDEESPLAWVETTSTTTTMNPVTLHHQRMDSLQSFNVCYGLLSLAPSLWSEVGGPV